MRAGGLITTVGLDADDTLWRNETLFRLTQARFAELASMTELPAWLDERQRVAPRPRRS